MALIINSSSNGDGNSGSSLLSSSAINNSVISVSDKSLRSDPATTELNNLLTQLNYKQTFQDEDSDLCCKSALVLATPEVSKVMGHLLGVEKKELKAEPREMFLKLEKFFKAYLKLVKVSNGSKGLELFQELFYNPEFAVFQQVLCNQPKEWVEMGLPLIQNKVNMEVLAEQVQKETQEVQLSRRELDKDLRLGKKELEEVKAKRGKKAARMSADNGRRLGIALASYQSDREKLEDTSKHGSTVKERDVTKLLSQFEELQVRHKAALEGLSSLSPGNALPPSIKGATRVLGERKAYFDMLMEQIDKLQPSGGFDLSNSLLSTPK